MSDDTKPEPDTATTQDKTADALIEGAKSAKSRKPKPAAEPDDAEEIAQLGRPKSVETIAAEVVAGRWGYGLRRMTQIEAAGYNYQEVADAVTALRNKPTS